MAAMGRFVNFFIFFGLCGADGPADIVRTITGMARVGQECAYP